MPPTTSCLRNGVRTQAHARTPVEGLKRAVSFNKPVQLLVTNLSIEGEKLAQTLYRKESGLRVLNACNQNAQHTLNWLSSTHQISLTKPFALSELLRAARKLLDA